MATIQRWQRICQECGYRGFYNKPNLESKTEAWRDTMCRRCKSQALDFGSEVTVDTATNKVIPAHFDEEE